MYPSIDAIRAIRKCDPHARIVVANLPVFAWFTVIPNPLRWVLGTDAQASFASVFTPVFGADGLDSPDLARLGFRAMLAGTLANDLVHLAAPAKHAVAGAVAMGHVALWTRSRRRSARVTRAWCAAG